MSLSEFYKKHIKAKILKEFKEIKYKNVFESDAKFVHEIFKNTN